MPYPVGPNVTGIGEPGRTAMLHTMDADGRKPAAPCPGLLDEAGVVRDACRVCGKCDDLIARLMQDGTIAGTDDRTQTRRQPAAMPA